MSKLLRSAPLWALIITVTPLRAELSTRLTPKTIERFDNYVKSVESELMSRRKGDQAFLEIDSDVKARDRVLDGEFLIRPESTNGSISFPGGLIHDWVGAAYIPNANIETVVGVLQDFDHHKDIYPEVIDSKLMQRSGDDLQGFWRLQQKTIITVVLDVQQDAHYQRVDGGRWICQSYSREISEIQDAGTSRERKLSEEEGHGYLWRLYAYWSFEQVNGGVLAECRTISLSRNVPVMLSWVVKPIVHGLPRESLLSTLRDTRTAAETRCYVSSVCKIRRESPEGHSVDSVRPRASERSSLFDANTTAVPPVPR